MESSGRFFRGNFYALAIVKLSTSFLSRKRSLVTRANASSGTFEYLSVSWVYSFLLISPIFSWREGRVFLVRFCSSMRVTGKLRIVFRDLFRALQRERVYKEFLKRLRKKNRILKSFFLLSFLQYRVTNSIVYNYHKITLLLIKRSHRKKPKLFKSYLDDQSHVSLNEHLRYQCDIRAWYAM